MRSQHCRTTDKWEPIKGFKEQTRGASILVKGACMCVCVCVCLCVFVCVCVCVLCTHVQKFCDSAYRTYGLVYVNMLQVTYTHIIYIHTDTGGRTQNNSEM